jgi:hypothetical protein
MSGGTGAGQSFVSASARSLIKVIRKRHSVVQQVMGHLQASTTLNRYTHTPADYGDRVLALSTTLLTFR